jgi:VIT1/CCC1 family predicted Fe2+/Mn2+ transporter
VTRTGIDPSRVRSFLVRPRERRLVPHPGPVPGEQRGGSGRSGALRAAIFGVNDGVVSNLSLIMGVTGAGASNRVILLAGVAGLVAGAFSMAAGEYISMRAQKEVFERLIHDEAHEIGTHPDREREELAEIFRGKGMPPDIAEQAARALMRDPKVALETHAREELGLDPDSLGSPWGAAASSFAAFAVGALIPLVPFLIGSGVAAAVASAAASGVTLFLVGASLTAVTGRGVLLSGARMLLVGTIAATVTYWVGSLLNVRTGI